MRTVWRYYYDEILLFYRSPRSRRRCVPGTVRGGGASYVGHYGGFDGLAAQAVKEARERHPEIRLTLVLPYHPAIRPINTPKGFDGTFYPWEEERIPKRLAIIKTNQRMVDTCDYLITYAYHFLGGTGQTVEYARKREKRGLIHVENLAEKFRETAL